MDLITIKDVENSNFFIIESQDKYCEYNFEATHYVSHADSLYRFCITKTRKDVNISLVVYEHEGFCSNSSNEIDTGIMYGGIRIPRKFEDIKDVIDFIKYFVSH